MDDQSHLDKKYFIDDRVYNCPFCNRKNLPYSLNDRASFNWSKEKTCFIYIVVCSHCKMQSMHLSYENLIQQSVLHFREDIELDEKIFHHQPTSFFVLDNRIPKVIRELIDEAQDSLNMNHLTGASACMRKGIYELLVHENIPFSQRVQSEEGGEKEVDINYETRIKLLRDKYPSIDADYFEILGHIKDMTSEKVHEQSWDKWDSKTLKFLIETLKSVLYEIYVTPQQKLERVQNVRLLREQVFAKPALADTKPTNDQAKGE